MPALIQSLRGLESVRLCRTGRPAWRLRLPPRARAQSRPCATPRRSGRRADRPVLPHGGAPRGGLRRALVRSCERRPRAGERRTSSTRRRSRTRSRTRCSRRSPGGTRSGTSAIADSGYGDSDRASGLLPALPAAGAGRGHAVRRPRTRRCWSRRSSCRWRRSSRRSRSCTGSPSSSSGRRLARPTLLLLAVFPAAVYFGAPYSESLFLLLAVGAFYAARTGHWAWAGACAGLASATRSAGLLLVLPLAMIWWGCAAAARRRRRLAPAGAARDRRLRRLARARGGRRAPLPRRAGGVVAPPRGAARRRLGRARGRVRRRAPARVGLAHAGLLRPGGGRPVPDRRHQRDAVRDARVRGGRMRGRVQAAAARVRGLGGRLARCCR